MNGWVFGAIMGYVLLQLGFGFYLSRRVESEDDYLLAGRKLGPLLVVFSVFATWFGAETCVGASGEVYAEGLSGASTDPFGYTLCIVLMGGVFARLFWQRRYTTLADLYRERFSPGCERLAVLLLAPTSILWAGAQIRAFGQILASTSALQVEIAISVAAIVVILYTSSGGLLADAWSDLVQGGVLIFGLLALSVSYFFLSADGVPLSAVPLERLQFFAPEAGWLEILETWSVPVIGSLFAQELIARTLAARSPEVASRATLAGGFLYLCVGLIPVALGLCAAQHMPGIEKDHLLIALAEKYLPGTLYIIFAGALVSAILSTVDTALLVAGSLFAHNLILPSMKEPDDRKKVLMNRIMVVSCGLVAWALAFTSDSVHELVEDASGFGSAGIAVTVLFGLFSGIGGRRACLASLLAGVTVFIFFNYIEAGIGAPISGDPKEGFAYPYLASLGAALVFYVSVAIFEEGEKLPELTQATALREADSGTSSAAASSS